MIDIKQIREKIISSFSDLEFKEDPHQYFMPTSDGQKKELMCVSNFVDQFSEPVDWQLVAVKYAAKNGESAEYWQNKWDENKQRAAQQGTLVHEYAESLAWVRNGFPEKICESARSQYDEKTNDLLPLDDGSLVALKEQAVYKFWQEMDNNLHFVMAENKVCTSVGEFAEEYPTNYAGTFDLLLYYDDPNGGKNSGFCIFDYKTNNELISSGAHKYRKFMLAPFEEFYEESKSHYIIQQSCYQIPLESIGLPVICRRLVWLKNDGSYELVKLPDVTERVKSVLKGKKND